MSFIGDAIGSIVGGITGASSSAKGQQAAANTQAAAVDKAIAYQTGADAQSRALQQPYVDAGSKALAAQMSLLGLDGTEAQQTAIAGLLTGPEYTTGVRQGEEAILQNAAATGGLRGGNTQSSLANFRADLLANVYQRQLGNVGVVTSLGQNAAAGVGNNIQNSAATVGNLLQQQGAAVAGGQIAAGNRNAVAFNNAVKVAGAVAGF